MSGQLMRPETTAFASDDPLGATDQEARWLEKPIGYWGTYTASMKAGVVTSHRGRLVDQLVGQNQTRAFQLSGDGLS